MKIKINGIIAEIENEMSLEKLLSIQEQLPPYYVVAVNYNCISSENYSKTKICDGDEIEIVSPMHGG